MSTNAENENEMLREGNYFLWEVNARMALARKDLAEHVEYKEEDGIDTSSAQWKSADRKALAVIARMLSTQYQTMIRTASTAKEAWETLESFFVKRTMHNRIQLRKKVHEFKMAKNDTILEHLLKFDNLVMAMNAVGEVLSEDEQLVILLGSLTEDFDAIVKIIENKGEMNMMEAKEMLLRESEKMKERETGESALRASGQDENQQTPRQQRFGQRGGRGGRGGRGRGRGQNGGRGFF
ncbi:gag-polypeptide of LTR copia-type [Phytophthora infestans]|uniref:Gag-polypeptide of LTR copia-type n=1 Tax=Phytophthora infestans TaxID=4787 RepID=A0A833SYD4_PHYIN|nr:gag-polypeptide of LTR copia-type [Phytophthora infestans]KAF4139614.1 gag-polypeptide of LTR copia-type [Phytophthora infestans]